MYVHWHMPTFKLFEHHNHVKAALWCDSVMEDPVEMFTKMAFYTHANMVPW